MRPFEPITWDELPESSKSILPADAAPAMKMIAARSLLPMGTRDLSSILYLLASDEDKRIRHAARRSLVELPEDLARAALSETLLPKIINWFAHRDLSDELLEVMLLNRAIVDETVAYLAGKIQNERLVNIVAQNQNRLLRSPEIVMSLFENEHTPVEVRERVRAFVEMSTGRTIEEIIFSLQPEIEEKETPLGDEQHPELADTEAVPEELMRDEAGEEPYESIPEDEIPPDFSMQELLRETFGKEDGFSAELLIDPEDDLTAGQRMTLNHRIRKMKVLDKMRLGLKGNIEARQILIKNANKMIQECVLRNPRMTVEEVIRLSKDKTMREELIRQIASHKEWVKNYQVIHHLCWNPKTPITQALKFINRLNIRDVLALSKSKQIPGMLAVAARKVADSKQKYK